jgi:hypothetical protein
VDASGEQADFASRAVQAASSFAAFHQRPSDLDTLSTSRPMHCAIPDCLRRQRPIRTVRAGSFDPAAVTARSFMNQLLNFEVRAANFIPLVSQGFLAKLLTNYKAHPRRLPYFQTFRFDSSPLARFRVDNLEMLDTAFRPTIGRTIMGGLYMRRNAGSDCIFRHERFLASPGSSPPLLRLISEMDHTSHNDWRRLAKCLDKDNAERFEPADGTINATACR